MRLAVCLSVMATLAGCSADEVDQKMTKEEKFYDDLLVSQGRGWRKTLGMETDVAATREVNVDEASKTAYEAPEGANPYLSNQVRSSLDVETGGSS